jgi:hypothetical protein
VRLEPLYRLTFRYDRSWTIRLGDDVHQLLRGEGRCEGAVSGRFSGQNRARRRVDGPFEPDYHGVIETDDGATILWHLTGFGWPEEGRVVTTVKHVTDDSRYERLNGVLCAVNGVVRDREVMLDVAELVWEPIP